MQFRKLIPIVILIMIWQSLFVGFAYAGPQNIIEQHQTLKKREQEIVAELVQAELALDAINREYNSVQAKLTETRANIPMAQKELAMSKDNLTQCQKRLSLWLRHFYIEGRTSYLMILFGAVDLGDFLNRLTMVGMLVSRGVVDFNKTLTAVEVVKDKTNNLAKLDQQLTKQQDTLQKTIQKSKDLQLQKEELLADTRKELGENQGKVLAVVDGLHQSLQPLETLLSRFKDAPWDKYKPDRMQWLGSKIKAEYSDSTISKLLSNGSGITYPVEANFSNHLFIIKGTTKEQLHFTIAGELSVSGENVRYKPRTIELDGFQLSNELVDVIGGKEGLTYPVGLLMGWRLKQIEIDEGKAVFELVPV